MRQVILIYLLLGTITRASGIENYRAGARSLALSDACVAVSDLWSSFHNQAGISGLDHVIAGIYYESRFYLKELSTVAGTVVLPTHSGNFAVSFNQFGRKSYKEEKVGLAFGKKLGKKIKAGIQFDYFSLTLPENERAKGCATIEGGIIYAPNENISLGMHVFNPIGEGIQYPEGKQKIPATLRIGGQYYFSETIMTCFEAEKESCYPLCFRNGFEYQPIKAIAIRFGMSGKPFRFTAGIGYVVGKLSADIGFSYYNSLGMNPSVSLQYCFR